jgi:hypothetical protein
MLSQNKREPHLHRSTVFPRNGVLGNFDTAGYWSTWLGKQGALWAMFSVFGTKQDFHTPL